MLAEDNMVVQTRQGHHHSVGQKGHLSTVNKLIDGESLQIVSAQL